MKEIRLLSLKLNNFKGCEHFVLTLDGRSASIYGDNAAGKTTIYDAVTWLLFGKDSGGRGDFEIKPLDNSGQVKDHAAITEVEAVFLADGSAVTFRKTFFERWSTKRGSVEASYDGNTSEYFVDDVPAKKYEFERRVDELVNEELFQTLTNVSWFCEQLDWKSRRKLLLEVCEVPEDQEIMAANEQFAPLAASIGNLSLDDHKKKLAAQRKGLNGTRNTIPARLDEQKKTIESLAGIDFAVLRVERDTKAARLEQLSSELLKLGHGALLDSKRNELVRVKNELAAYLNENNSYRQSQMVPIQDERPALNAGLELAKKRLARSAALAANEKELIDSISEMIEGCRTSWSSVDAETFRASNCPTCGHPLPADAQTVARSKFDADKERRKAEIVAAADREKRNLEAARFRRESYINDAVAAENEAARLENALRTYIPTTPPEITNLSGYDQRVQEFESLIHALEDEVAKLQSENTAIREEISAKVAVLRSEITDLDKQLAQEGYLDLARRREEELRQEAKKAAQTLEALDRQLYLCEEFTRFKVRFIEDSINQKFRLARFKLFDEQVNGGLADCCEATYDGIPYRSLNSGMRINLGIDVIRTISEHYGLRVPLVVDNAESVVKLSDARTQVIRLVVSGADKDLRCEYED